mgnify:FL=1|tara:strand:- start:406 stop:1137 length:732 start_codon:yes stop_codon:yes gene_type:complete
MPKILKMIDKSDAYTTQKKDIFNLPMRILAIGKTGCGKSSSCLGNFLLRPEFYKDDFLPENIYIFSGSLEGDLKLRTIINQLEIPKENLFDSFDEEIGHEIYDTLVDNFNEKIENKERPENSLFIFDDLGFTNLQNKNSKNSILDKLFSNGRKYLISTITLNQRATQLSTNAREQANGIMLWKSSISQLELLERSFNYLQDKKQFFNMIRSHTQDNHDFIVIDMNDKNMYKDINFKPIEGLNY